MQARNSKEKGERTEAKVLSHLVNKGYAVLVPWGNNQRYDLVIDKGDGHFVRGQCKTGRLVDGCVAFAVSSKNGFTGIRKSYHNQVDVFWVAYEDQVYEIPIGMTGINQMRLRIEPPKKTFETIHWAEDFLI